MEIGIGDKTWPIGLPIEDVYSRTGKQRIFQNYVLHHMNNKVQKRYIIAFKRLLKLVEKYKLQLEKV